MPEDNYPTEEELKMVEEWPIKKRQDCTDLLGYIKTIWWAADWGWHDPGSEGWKHEEKDWYHISTAGWSGNEDIIASMKKNYMFWMFTWQESRRGGHYKFKVE